MFRAIAAGGAALALAGCAHAPSARTSPNAATLGAYVVEATPWTPASPAPGRPDAAACSQGRDAYRVLVFLVSSDTGTSVEQIAGDLRAGRSLSDIAGSHAAQVEGQAIALVQVWLQFAEANGKLTAGQVAQYRAVAAAVINALMKANVAACMPAAD